jgi:hypothetical protein
MVYRALTELTVFVHFAFLLFVIGGAWLVRRWPWVAAPHLLAAAWGVYVEAMPGIICPLTPLENRFAALAGQEGYTGSFVEHYLVPILYPDGLTRNVQWTLAGLVLGINVVAYGLVLRQRRAERTTRATASASAASIPSSQATR